MNRDLGRRLTAEATGSFFLFAGVIGSGVMAEALAGGNVAVALLANTLATGAIMFVLIAMLGPVSGAHFNPAVSGVMAARGDIRWREAALYVAAQLAGGVLGALGGDALVGGEFFGDGSEAHFVAEGAHDGPGEDGGPAGEFGEEGGVGGEVDGGGADEVAGFVDDAAPEAAAFPVAVVGGVGAEDEEEAEGDANEGVDDDGRGDGRALKELAR